MDNKYSALIWQIGNWIVWIVIVYLTDIDYIYLPIIVPVLNLMTKELNKTFNDNYKD